MELEKIIKNSQDFLSLQNELQNGTMAKSILLITKDEQYSFEFATLLASLIFNKGQMQENENYYKTVSFSHPDLKCYPLKDKIMVADSDSIVEESSIKPIFADKKVFIIRNIDNAMEQAQNKLLKTLEEPANNVYFILTTKNINLVLPTIRSRCAKIELSKLSQKEIDALGMFDGLVSGLCDGYAGKAIALSEKANLQKIFDSTLAVITNMKNSKRLLAFSKELVSFKDDFSLIIEIMSVIFEDMLFIKVGKKDKVRLKDYVAKLQDVEGEYTIEAISHIRKLLDEAVKEMQFNCNFTLVIENLLLNILEVKFVCR